MIILLVDRIIRTFQQFTMRWLIFMWQRVAATAAAVAIAVC